MSSFIPMVSASPPPMEDDKTFEWEDDDDFGTFTGANDSVTKETNSETDQNWSNTIPKSPEESPSKDIDFADFNTFNDNIQGSKPSVTDLPLNSNIISNNKMSPSSDINKMSESVESLDLSERNSTQTTLKRDSDSGMFSSDLSPTPVAKEMLASDNCDNDYTESTKLNDSSPETPEEMTLSEHGDGLKESPSQTDLDLPTLVENNLDNKISIKDGRLVDSDEDFDDYSSNVLQTLCPNAAQSSMNPPIKNDSQLNECDDSVVNKSSFGPISTQLSCSDDDEFGDFAEFSGNQLPNQSQITSKVDSAATSASTETESDMAVPHTHLEKEDQIKIKFKDHQESHLVESSDSNSGKVIQERPCDDSHSKVEEPSSGVKNPENDSQLNDLSDDEYNNFSENVKTADVVYVDGSSSDSLNDVTKTNVTCETDLQHDSVCEKVPLDLGDSKEDFDNVIEANDTDKQDVLNNGLDHTDDDFADFHKANDSVIENCKENQFKSDSDDDFADFSCAKVRSSEENKEDFAISAALNDNDEFADFSHSKSEDENQIDDDFADFSSAVCTIENKNVAQSQNDNDDDDNEGDDFADFSSAKTENNSAINSEREHFDNKTNMDNDDFADFSSADKSEDFVKFENKKENDDWGNFSDDDNDEFGNFNEATVIKEAPKPAASTVSQTPDVAKIKKVLETCFTEQTQADIDEQKTCDIIMLDSLLQGSVYTHNTKPLTRQDIIKKVLKHIEDYDNTNALMYSWKKSHSNNRLFKTLRIDTQNMLFGLKKQAVPLSLTGLTLLEPIRGQLDSSKKDRVLANLVEPTSTDSIPQLQDMPPVEFDWHNSGLTNPLEAKTLDLDFMVLQENENNAKTRVFQSELLDAPRSSVKPMQPLEDILKNMKATTMPTPFSEPPQTENLSKEADNVIKSLPLLSFMKSKVLMFKLNS